MTSEEFLDAAILGLARSGPLHTIIDFGCTTQRDEREDRDTWAARVVEDAMALAARRERKLAEIAAMDAATSAMKITRGAPQSTPDAALDAEAEALWSAWYGDMPRDLSWRDMTDSGKADWRRVALKAREMHAKRASASECAKVYFAAHGSYRDGVRAVLQHLGVEVTP